MRLALSTLVLAATPLLAQQTAEPAGGHHHDPDMTIQGGGVFPPGWSVRPDEGGQPTGVKFEPMAPGFHLTMATAAIVYRTADSASGPTQIVATIHLFPKKGAPHEEGFGLFIGGQDLAGAEQRYTYFIIRGDGSFKLKRRSGSATTDLAGKDWTPSPAIPVADSTKVSTPYELGISIGKDRVSFLVNGKEVTSAAAKDVDTAGIVGLRVNHNLSVHVEQLAVHRL